MILTAPLLISGVRASVQIYLAGDKALSTYTRNRKLVFPNAQLPPAADNIDLALSDVEDKPGFREFLDTFYKEEQLLDKARDFYAITPDAERKRVGQRLTDAKLVFDATEASGLSASQVEEFTATFRIPQWIEKDPAAPDAEPWLQFAVDFGVVLTEFVGANPSVLQVGGDAERIVGAFATSVNAILEESKFSDKAFGSQVLSLVLRAGLQTVTDQRGLLFDDVEVQKLVEAVWAPILKKLAESEGDIVTQRQWKALVRDLAAPVGEAAFGVLAEHQEAFLGKRFATDEILGKMTAALLDEVNSGGLADILQNSSAQGQKAFALRLFRAVVGVAGAHPALILKGNRTTDQVLRDFMKSAAQAVIAADQIDDALGLEIVASGLEAMSKNTPALVALRLNGDSGNAWEAAVEKSIQHVLRGLSGAARNGRKLEDSLTRTDIVAIGRIFFEQIAVTPQMIAAGNEELGAVVKAVATQIVADEDGILSADDWQKIAAVAVAEAGRNPGRLFGFDESGETPGAQVVSELMQAASEALESSKAGALGPAGANVLFGETLRIAMEIALGAVSGQTAAGRAVLSKKGTLKGLANQISVIVAAQEDNVLRYGAREWLALWRAFLPELIVKGKPLAPMVTLKIPLSGEINANTEAMISRVIDDVREFSAA